MAPASLNRPASPLRSGPNSAGPSERHCRGDAGAGRAASRLPDSCLTEPIQFCALQVWGRIFAALSDDPDFEYAIIDSTIVRAHQNAADAKGGLKSGDRPLTWRPDQQDILGCSRLGAAGALHPHRRPTQRHHTGSCLDRGVAGSACPRRYRLRCRSFPRPHLRHERPGDHPLTSLARQQVPTRQGTL
jgi:hypothetical protein